MTLPRESVRFDVEHGSVVLTTENGIEVTNTIYLEPEVVERLQDYLKASRHD